MIFSGILQTLATSAACHPGFDKGGEDANGVFAISLSLQWGVTSSVAYKTGQHDLDEDSYCGFCAREVSEPSTAIKGPGIVFIVSFDVCICYVAISSR